MKLSRFTKAAIPEFSLIEKLNKYTKKIINQGGPDKIIGSNGNEITTKTAIRDEDFPEIIVINIEGQSIGIRKTMYEQTEFKEILLKEFKPIAKIVRPKINWERI